MGRKGWAGAPPADDDDARKRIIDAALICIERNGPAETTLSVVADELGVTRRTIYRYFAGTDDLFLAAAELALNSFVARVEALTAELDASDQLIEVVAYIIEQLPHEPQLALLLANDQSQQVSQRMLHTSVITRCRIILQHTHIDWAASGYDDAELDSLVEFLLRLIQSMVIAPRDPELTPEELRAFLRRWVTPAIT